MRFKRHQLALRNRAFASYLRLAYCFVLDGHRRKGKATERERNIGGFELHFHGTN